MDAQSALSSVLGRLAGILVNETRLLGGVRGDVEFIKDDMEIMNSLLLHLTDAQHRDHQVRAWMKQIIDLSRDCGGNVELYVHYVGGVPAGITGYLRRVPRFVRTIPVRHRIATRIREFKVRARNLGDRRLRYGVTVPPAPPPDQRHRTITDKLAPQPGGPEEEEDLRRRELLFGEPPDTVEEGTNMVLEWMSKRETSIIGIVGMGSLGKTSIAKRVYQHPSVMSSIHHRAWINLGGSERPLIEVCWEILEQLRSLPDMSRSYLSKELLEESWGQGDLICTIKHQLPGKKFLIVLDDITRPENGDGSYFCHRLFNEDCFFGNECTVILTSRESVDCRHWDDYRSFDVLDYRPAFFQRRALALAKCEFSPISAVLQECYHDVFALHMLLHLLYVNPDRSERELNRLRDALHDQKNNVAKTMLMFCYNELPRNYKSCLLYLSIFAQDHRIRRTSLIRRWVSEGLITDLRPNVMGTPYDQAEHIFDALVTRGFVRPVETSTVGKIKSCTVHHIVHDFILTDISLVDTLSPPDLAHRFSINSGIEELQQASPPKSNRPLHDILTLLESAPASPQWQLLKVLDLEGCKGIKKKHLKNVCKILLLKYLSLRNTDVTELPKQIKKLQCLETLDIRQTEVRAFATKSILLPMLKHLLAGSKVSPSKLSDWLDESPATLRLPSGTRRMTNLEVLSDVDASDNPHDLIDIGHLLQLRKLGVILNGKIGGLALLFQQIAKLHSCLRSLSIQINQSAKTDNIVPETEQVDVLVPPPKLLQSLKISGITTGLPCWITKLDQLTAITLSETYLGQDAIHILGNLRILRSLRLRRKSYIRTELSFKINEFQHLKSLIVESSDIANITFDKGAAPKLEMVVWSYVSIEALSLLGVDHLPKLKKLELNGDCNPARHAIEAHANCPVLKHNIHQQS